MANQSPEERTELARQQSIQEYRKSARAWWDSGRRYYIVTLSLGGTVAGWTTQTTSSGHDASGIIQAIEDHGWTLHHIGYVYQPLKERSHAFSDSAVMTGDVLGVYTFERGGSELPPMPIS